MRNIWIGRSLRKLRLLRKLLLDQKLPRRLFSLPLIGKSWVFNKNWFHHVIFHLHLQKRSKLLIKTSSVADFKNMYQTNYEDIQITFKCHSIVADFEHVLIYCGIFRNNKLEEFSKITLYKRSGNFKEYIICKTVVVVMVKTSNCTKNDSQRCYSLEALVHGCFGNKCF